MVALKDIRSASASSKVNDNFAFLEFLATNVSKGGSTSPPQSHAHSQQAQPTAYVTSTAQHNQIASSSSSSAAHQKSLRRRLGVEEQLTPISSEHNNPSSSTAVRSEGKKEKNRNNNNGQANDPRTNSLSAYGADNNNGMCSFGY